MKVSRSLAICLSLAAAAVTIALIRPAHRPDENAIVPATASADRSEADTAPDASTAFIADPLPESEGPSPQTLEEFGKWALAKPRQPDMRKIAAFDAWIERWKTATPEERRALEEEGAQLAGERREEFKALIATNPRLALEEAVPRVIRQDLPKAIVDSLEKPVSSVGDYNVYMGRPAPGIEMPEGGLQLRYFEADGMSYQARVFGEMEPVMSKPGIPLRGVAIDREFAVAESPLRQLEVGERIPEGTTVQENCPVSGKTTEAVSTGEAVTEQTPTVEVGSDIITLCDGSHVTVLDESYRTAIQASGPGGATTYVANFPGASAKSIGDFHCLYIRVTYPDQMVAPNTEDTAYGDMRNTTRYYLESSYGKLTTTPVVTPVIVMPHTMRWYLDKDGEVDGLGLVHSDARAAARKLGYDSNQFTCTIVRVNGGPKLAGTSWGGGSSVWITWNGMDVLNHECGHSLGRNHANYWNANDGTAYGNGTNGEYGNSFDVMGGAYGFSAHYNTISKRALGWLPDRYVNLPKTNGTYRIHAYDQPQLEEGKRYALSVAKDTIRSYNVEYHPARGGLLADSALVLYSGMGSNAGHLLDTTPGSAGGKGDGGIAVGRTFSDLEADMHFTVVSKNATSPPSLDVVYNRGPFPGNVAPTLSLAASATTISAGGNVTFTATASDANGDPLAYQWDFDDGVTGTNTAVFTRSFPAVSQVTAMLTVSDMKGGTARSHVVINVGAHGKQSVTGTITAGGSPLANVRVSNGTKYAYTDSSGNYALSGLATGAATLTATLNGYTFTPSFTNPLTVVAGTNTADWTAGNSTFVTLAKVADAAEGGASGTFRFTRTGDTSADLVVRISPVGGTAVKTTDYTFTPDFAADGSYKSFTIPAGSATLDVTVAAVNDAAAEGPETITMQLASNGSYLSTSGNAVVMTVADDDTTLPQVAVTAPDPYAVENGGDPGSFVFTRAGSTASALNLAVAWSGSATNGTDYTTLPATVTIPSGQSSYTLAVTPIDDSAIETPEDVIATISANAAYVRDTAATTATVTISDDDTPVVTVSVPDGIASEPGTDTGTFLITRSGSTAAPLKVYYGLSGSALQGIDYAPLTGEVTIPAGSASAPVVVSPYDDDQGEPTEDVTLAVTTFDNAYSIGADFQGSLTIADDNDGPLVSVRASAAGVEGGANTSVIFRAIGSGSGTITVNYTVSGTATAGSDYTALSGSVTLQANGANEVSVPITILNDSTPEPTETVVVTITPSSAYIVYNDGSAEAAIRDDDSGAERVMVSTYNESASEAGPATARVYFSRAGTTGNLTVNYTLSGTATNGTDYSSLGGSIVIPDTEQGVNLSITPIDDATVEGTETVVVEVAPGTGYSVDRPSVAVVEIADNDAAAVTVGFQAASLLSSEQPGGLGEYRDIPVVLSTASSDTVTVEYTSSGGTASGDDVDWSFADAANGNAVIPGGILTFPPGTTTKNLRIRVKNDGVAEVPETALIELRAARFASLKTDLNKLTVLIYDDNVPPVVLEERWAGSTPYNTQGWASATPNYTGFLYGFTPAQNVANSFSRRLVGQVVAPATGTYNFWIASDDGSRLYLSTDSTAANKSQIASLASATSFQSWDTNPTQKSANVTLTAGQSYYLEVQHLEGSGSDHVSVAWQGPGFSRTPVAFTPPESASPRTVRMVAAASTVSETSGSAPLLIVTLDRPAGSTAVIVNYSVGGTATAGSDYTLSGGTLTFATGEQMKLLPLAILTDGVNEAPETVVVTLSGPSGASLVAPASHTVTILDANAPLVTDAAFDAHAGLAPGTALGTVVAAPAPGRTVTGWSIESGDPSGVFSISSGGQLGLVLPNSLTLPGTTYNLVVRATDNAGAAADGTVIVSVLTANGVWTNLAGGSWPTTGNWSAGLVAKNVGGAADFSTLNLTADATVTLDGARTVGSLVFADATTASHNWTLNAGSGGALTMDALNGTPSIAVNNQTATLGVALAGNEGLVKTGAGKLVLAGNNTLTGGVNLNGTGLVTLSGSNAANTWAIPNGQFNAGVMLAGNTALASGSVVNASSNASFPWGIEVANGVNAGTGSVLNFNGASGRFSVYLGTNSVYALNTVMSGTNPFQVMVGSGSVISGDIDLGAAQINVRNDFTAPAGVTKNNTGVFTISGKITGTNASGINVPNTFTGTWALSGANEFTGATVVSGYTLSINSIRNVNGGPSALGAVTTVAAGTINMGNAGTGGTLVYTGTGDTSDRVINLNGATGGAILDQSGTGLLKLTGGVTATGAGAKTLTLRGSTAGSGEIAGAIANSTSATAVTKTGTGVWTLSGANSYTGATTVSAGTLRVNGSNAASTTTVATGATLGGTGILNAAVTVNGSLEPGAGGIGTLTVNANLALAATSATRMEIGHSGATAAGDRVGGIAAVTYGGTLTVTDVGPDPLAAGDSFQLFSASSYAGSFSSVTLPVLPGGLIWNTSKLSVDGTVAINHPPVFASDPVDGGSVAVTDAYSGTLAAVVSDADPGDTLTFAKGAGPSWLSVASNGALSGTPAAGDLGVNAFTVSATDSLGAVTSATLNVTVLALPSGFAAADVGSPGATGFTSYSGGVYTISGAGSDIYGTSDNFHFASQPLTGDFDIRARVTSQTNTHISCKAGVMIRNSLAANSVNAMMEITPANDVIFQSRATAGGSTSSVHGPATNTAPNNWVRLVRIGSSFTAFYSVDGTAWTPIGTATLTMGGTVYAGLAVSSHVAGTLGTATFDNYGTSAVDLPSPWSTADIGAVAATGSAFRLGGDYTVTGSGADIAGTADEFRSLHQTGTGDCEIVARVSSQTNPNAAARAGVVIRDGSAANAVYAAMLVTPGSGTMFQYRTSTGGTTTTVTGPALNTAPNNWVKLVRSGSTFTAYFSADGSSWTSVGSTSLTMGGSVNLGTAVTSHLDGKLGTAVFDNFSVTP